MSGTTLDKLAKSCYSKLTFARIVGKTAVDGQVWHDSCNKSDQRWTGASTDIALHITACEQGQIHKQKAGDNPNLYTSE
jgi:hypothetical protein